MSKKFKHSQEEKNKGLRGRKAEVKTPQAIDINTHTHIYIAEEDIWTEEGCGDGRMEKIV
jgi:hypothetical protein